MRVLKVISALFLAGCAAAFLWVALVPQSATEIGHSLDDPTPLLGCYFYGRAEIQLSKNYADFNEERVPISFGLSKNLEQVLYPSRYPWVDVKQSTFRFRDDRFELLDLQQDSQGEWAIELWTSDYLESGDPQDLRSVVFRRGDCG